MKGAIVAVVAVAVLLGALDAFDVRARAVAAVRADLRDYQAQVPAPAPAAAKDAAPVLSETDRLKVVNASLAVENWTLKVQASVGELQKARAEFDRIVGVVTPAGWRLNEQLEFVKVDKPKGGG